MEIRFEVPEFHASVAEVRRTAASLAEARARASGEASLLLDGWRGAASAEFADAWEVWLRASAEVVSSLAGLADLLEAFRSDVLAQDESSASAVATLAGRLS
jgi:WXG100 family type VII secretion target